VLGKPIWFAGTHEHLRLAAAVARSAGGDFELPLSLETEADSLDPAIS
jgi:hypothetical protein